MLRLFGDFDAVGGAEPDGLQHSHGLIDLTGGLSARRQKDMVKAEEVNLILHGDDCRGVTGARVGTEYEEQVGKSGERCAVVGAGTAILRLVINQVFAMFADNLVPRQLAVDVEAIGTHYDVGGDDASFGPDAIEDKLKKTAVCKLNTRVMEGLEMTRVVDAPLAANLEIRNQHVVVTRWRCGPHVALERLSPALSQSTKCCSPAIRGPSS